MPLVAIGQIEDSVPGLFRFLINSLVVGFEQKGWRAAAKRTSPIDISRHATSSYWSFSGDLSWAKHVVDRCSSQFLPMHFPPFFVFPIFILPHTHRFILFFDASYIHDLTLGLDYFKLWDSTFWLELLGALPKMLPVIWRLI